MKSSSSGQHQPLVIGAQDTLLGSHLAQGKAGWLRSQLLASKQLFPTWSRSLSSCDGLCCKGSYLKRKYSV